MGEVAEFKGNFILAQGHYRDAIRRFKVKKDDLGIARAEAKIASLIKEEQPGKAKLNKIPTLRPAFKAGGTITASMMTTAGGGVRENSRSGANNRPDRR